MHICTLQVSVEWQAFFVCIKLHTAIHAVLVTEHIVRQYLEPIIQDKQLPKLKLEGLDAFFWRDFPQPYIKIYIV